MQAFPKLGALGAAVLSAPRLRRDAPALALLLSLALLAVAPVLPALRQAIPGWPGDNLLYAYALSWMAQAPLLGRSPFVDPRLNFPDDLPLLTNDLPYLGNLAVAPATWLLGPAFGYNLVVLLSLVGSGYATYLWALRVTASRPAAAIAGAAFLLTPFRLAHLFGHLNLVATFGLPLFFWALDRALGADGRRLRAALLLAGATFLVGSASQYYLLICLLVGLPYGLLRALPDLGALLRRGWSAALGGGAGALASALPYLSVFGSGALTPYSVEETRVWSADPLNFLLPWGRHPLWGGLVEGLRPEPLWVEKTLYVGAVAGALALAGLALARGEQRRQAFVWAGAGLAAAVLALGTDLHIAGQPLSAERPLWLPAYYVGQLPFGSLVRAWSRFGVLTIMFTALLAGVGAAALLGRLGRMARPAAVAIGLLLVLDLAPPLLPTTPASPRAVDRWLAAQPADLVAGALPALNGQVNSANLLASTFHGHQMPAYIHVSRQSAAYQHFRDASFRLPDPAGLVELRALGIDLLLFHRDWYNGRNAPDWPLIEAALAAAGAPIVADLDGVAVVDLRGLR